MAAVGDKVPNVEVKRMGEAGPEAVQTGDALGSGKVVLFAVPGAFTPGCSKIHMPGFVQGAEDLKSKGVDKVVCVSVNDAFVMAAWGDAQGATGKIEMLADPSGDFAKAMGLTFDGSAFGLGVRSQRYAAVIENGVIKELDVEPGPGVSVSACSAIAEKL
jgi:peroxiredoxin